MKAPRIFRTETAGEWRVGIEFAAGTAADAEAALEAFLGKRGVVLLSSTPAITSTIEQPVESEARRVGGRPSKHGILAETIDALGDELDGIESQAAQVRRVREHLVSAGLPVPSETTTRTFLATYRRPKTSARELSRENLREAKRQS